MTWSYDVLSNCGQSFARPFFAYLAVVALTAVLALVHAAMNSPTVCVGESQYYPLSDLWRENTPCRTEQNGANSAPLLGAADDLPLSGYRAAAEYTLIGAVGVLEFPGKDKRVEPINKRLFAQAIEPPAMRLWSVLRAIFSTLLLFLVALGLRNNYRLR